MTLQEFQKSMPASVLDAIVEKAEQGQVVMFSEDEYEAAESWSDIHPYSKHLLGGPFDWNEANSEVREILKSGLYPYGIARPNVKSLKELTIFSFKPEDPS